MRSEKEATLLLEASHRYATAIKSESVCEELSLLIRTNAFVAGAQWQKDNGSINWISVDKELPPAWRDKEEDNTLGYSETVLCFDKKTGRIWTGRYCHNPFYGPPEWKGGGLRDNVTHFAYINLPE